MDDAAFRGSAFRRVGVVSEAVTLADLTVATVDQQFALLVLSDSSCLRDRFSLCLMHRGCARIARTTNGPAIGVGDDMLVLAISFTSFLALDERLV